MEVPVQENIKPDISKGFRKCLKVRVFLSTSLSPEYNESNSLKQVSAMHSFVYEF